MSEFSAEELAQEKWLPIPWLRGRYEVSDLGRVKSLIQKGNGYAIPKTRILSPRAQKGRYPRVGLPEAGKPMDECRVFWSMHSLVLTVFVGPRPKGMEGAHNDGNTSNNRLSNLRWATRSENHRDKRLHGTARIGSKAPNAKLTEAQVRELRELYSTAKYTQKQLAKRFGLSNPCSVGQIIRGERWAHVDVEVLQKALNETQDALAAALKREAEAQQARERAESEWLKRLQLVVGERDGLRAAVKLNRQDWQRERDTLRGLLRDIWEDPASGALKDDIFHRLERITAALPKEGE